MKHLVLLHGAIGSAAHFKKLIPLLEKEFIIHAPDFPGHGGSEMPSAFSIEFFAQQLEEYCRINSLLKINVFGYSMGGYVALYLAHKNSSLIERVITLGTVFNWTPEIAAKESAKLQPSIIEMKVPKFAAALAELHHPGDWKEVLEKTAVMLNCLGTNNLLSKEILSAIENPCLLMLGDRDKMVDRQNTEEVFDTMPHSQLAILPATPHAIEQCDEFLLAIMIRRFFL